MFVIIHARVILTLMALTVKSVIQTVRNVVGEVLVIALHVLLLKYFQIANALFVQIS